MQTNSLKQLSGIDTLYYYAETNENYDLFFIDLLDEIESQRDGFRARGERYQYGDIVLDIEDYSLYFTGDKEGFYWLQDKNSFYRIGFKDKFKNRTQHNIRVQLSAVGIYTIGIKSLLELINNNLLREITTGKFPITRIDVNAFVQYDFSDIDRSSFVSRKRNYAEILKDYGSSQKTETLYVGKKPFLLRLYNKILEMKKSDKEELMEELFLNNGLSLDEPIFNIEFEMHRQYLKYLSINTVEEAILGAEQLFKQAMDSIRYVDLSTVSKSDISNGDKYKAQTQPLWEMIRDNYRINDFLQTKTPLKRIKRIQYEYTYDKAIEEFYQLGRKAKIHRIDIDNDFFQKVLEKVEESFEMEVKAPVIVEPSYTEIVYEDGKLNKEVYRLKEGELFKPIKVRPLNLMSDQELKDHYDAHIKKLEHPINKGNKHLENIILVATKEMEARKLLHVPF